MNRPFHRDEQQLLIQLALANGCRSFLEVGARHGYNFDIIVRALPAGSKAVAIDYPGRRWGKLGSDEKLREIIYGLCEDGYDAHLIIGPSASHETVEQAVKLGPYDLVYIDADHTEKCVRKDFEIYGPMGRMVAFHDIAAIPWDGVKDTTEKMGVPIVWNELKQGRVTAELVHGKPMMGIGVLWNERIGA